MTKIRVLRQNSNGSLERVSQVRKGLVEECGWREGGVVEMDWERYIKNCAGRNRAYDLQALSLAS
jgi:hypothetical protein